MSDKRTPFDWEPLFGAGREKDLETALLDRVRPVPSLEVPLASRCIRVLQLDDPDEAASWDSPLTGTLLHTNLDDPTLYAALSYVWGAPVFNKTILLHGEAFAITTSLDWALRSCRDRGYRSLWVVSKILGHHAAEPRVHELDDEQDQICVNQRSLSEKSVQVPLMWEIYSKARIVLIDLGPEHGSNRDALDILNLVHQEMHLPEVQANRHEWIFEPNLRTVSNSDLRWGAIATILTHPWFERAWTLQEAVAARKCCLLFVGDQVPIGFLIHACLYHIVTDDNTSQRRRGALYKSAEYDANAEKISQALTTLREMTRLRASNPPLDHQRDLFRLVEEGQKRLASDPRDMIFAYMGIARDAQNYSQPNYHSSVEFVFITFAVETLRAHPLWLNIMLSTATVRHSSSWLPSWVPDWSQKPQVLALGTVAFNIGDETVCSEPSLASVKSLSVHISGQSHDVHRILTLEGAYDATVVVVGPMLGFLSLVEHKKTLHKSIARWYAEALETFAEVDPEIWSTAKDLMAFVTDKELDVTEQHGRMVLTKLTAVASVMIANAFDNRLGNLTSPYAGQTYSAFRLLNQYAVHDTVPSTDEQTALLSQYIVTVLTISCGRRLGLVRGLDLENKVALLPASTGVGDEIILLDGVYAPFVARSVDNNHRLIGDAYVEGVKMDVRLGSRVVEGADRRKYSIV